MGKKYRKGKRCNKDKDNTSDDESTTTVNSQTDKPVIPVGDTAESLEPPKTDVESEPGDVDFQDFKSNRGKESQYYYYYYYYYWSLVLVYSNLFA